MNFILWIVKSLSYFIFKDLLSFILDYLEKQNLKKLDEEVNKNETISSSSFYDFIAEYDKYKQERDDNDKM